jgi:hypothetical protein
MTSPYWTILATAVGGLLTLISGVLTSILTQRGTLKREQEAKRVEWERQRIEAERKNLRELQEALKDVVDNAIASANSNCARSAGYQSDDSAKTIVDGPYAQFGRAATKAQMLLSWAPTEELRSASIDVLQKSYAFSQVKTAEEEYDQPRGELAESFAMAVLLIGRAARELAAPGPP